MVTVECRSQIEDLAPCQIAVLDWREWRKWRLGWGFGKELRCEKLGPTSLLTRGRQRLWRGSSRMWGNACDAKSSCMKCFLVLKRSRRELITALLW